MAVEEDDARSDARLSRAQLLKRAGVVGAAAAVPAGVFGPAAAVAADSHFAQLKALTAAEATTLEAVLERLIPTDATGPGAKEANVLRYVDWALAGELSLFRDPYSAALAALDAYSVSTQGAQFASLSAAQQDAVLTAMDKNTATGFQPSAKAVFEMIRGHAVQGMFGDPAHGGNVGFVGWDLVRFPGPRLKVSAHDQKLDVVPTTKVRKSTYDYALWKRQKAQQKG
jgi:gluconate 2-dehydrogenase gamma chain